MTASAKLSAPLLTLLSFLAFAPSCWSGPHDAWPPQRDSEGNDDPAELDAWLARRDDPKAYVGLFGENAVAVVDTREGRVTAKIPVPKGPHGVAMSPDGRTVFVSSDGASSVSVIDTATDRVAETIEVGAAPHGLAVSADGRRLLVAGFGTNRLVVVDARARAVVGEVSVPQPHNLAIARDGRTAYVGSQLQGSTAIAIVDLQRLVVVGSVPLEKTPRALALDAAGARLFVTVAGADALQVVDLAKRRVAGTIAGGVSPHVPVLAAGTGALLVVSQGSGELEIVDAASDAVRARVGVGRAPHWVAASSDGRAALVTNEGSNDVSVVDVENGAVVATIPVGIGPRKIAVQAGPISLAARAAASMPAAAGESRAEKDVRGLREAEIEADDRDFKPAVLRGDPGQKLRLTVENESGALHNVSIAALGIDRDVPPKGKIEIDVTFPREGATEFVCKIHAAMGMKGALVVGGAR